MAGNKEDYTGDSSTTNGSTNNSTSTEQTTTIKYIQKKSAVKPLTGKIVNTVNIDDKTTNTYSASIIDQKIAAGAPSEGSGDSVFVSQTLTSGTKIGTITVNDVGTDLYAPTPSTSNTTYSDITIEAHNVPWKGGQIYNGSIRDYYSTNTITKSGYYPIGVTYVVSNSRDRKYTLMGQSNKGNGTITVQFHYRSGGSESVAEADMTQATVFVAWVKIK